MTDQDNNLDFAFRMLDYDNSKSYQARKTAHEAKKAEIPPDTQQEIAKAEYNAKKALYCNKRTAKQKRRAAKKFEQEKQEKLNSNLKGFMGIFLVFSIISFLTMCILNTQAGLSINKNIRSNGGIVGPFKVEHNNAVYMVKVTQHLKNNLEIFVRGNVLDKNGQILFGFGNSLWEEYGVEYDSYGSYPWDESKTQYDAIITFPKKGIYSIQFDSEYSIPNQKGTISIELIPKAASSLFFAWLSAIGFIISLSCFIWYFLMNIEKNISLINFTKEVVQEIFWIALIAICIWAEL